MLLQAWTYKYFYKWDRKSVFAYGGLSDLRPTYALQMQFICSSSPLITVEYKVKIELLFQ